MPAGTAELVLYVMNVQPVEDRLFVDWAVAGIDPSLEGIEAGELPKGAVVGNQQLRQARLLDLPPAAAAKPTCSPSTRCPSALAPPARASTRARPRQEILDRLGQRRPAARPLRARLAPAPKISSSSTKHTKQNEGDMRTHSSEEGPYGAPPHRACRAQPRRGRPGETDRQLHQIRPVPLPEPEVKKCISR